MARAIDNIQINIKNFYFRFEGGLSRHQQDHPKRREKFCIGVKLRQLKVFTGNSEYERLAPNAAREKKDNKLLTYKVLRMDGISLFCDWGDIDKPECGAVDPKEACQAAGGAYLQEVLEREFPKDPGTVPAKHVYVLQDFALEARVQLNKDIRDPLAPATLAQPQLKVVVMIAPAAEMP